MVKKRWTIKACDHNLQDTPCDLAATLFGQYVDRTQAHGCRIFDSEYEVVLALDTLRSSGHWPDSTPTYQAEEVTDESA